MEYTIYTDESGKNGKYFSNFYGGAIIKSSNIEYVNKILLNKKSSLNISSELKWQRVTSNYLDKYIELMSTYFELIKSGKIKIRIMFKQNLYVACGLTPQQKDDEFLLLYYQFIKHAFGLNSPTIPHNLSLRIYCDELPVRPSKKSEFISYLHRIQQIDGYNISMRRDAITDVDSKKHPILQYMDVILGAMYFRLNDLHKQKKQGSSRRGKRTIAKEKLYKHIYSEINELKPNFNIGISTGPNTVEARWAMPYRHWRFVPKSKKFNPNYTSKHK